MRRGDTFCLMLNVKVNGEDMTQGAYDEIELQINKESSSKSIKKLLSDGDIVWDTVTYLNKNNVTETFTGYVAYFDQDETFKLNAGQSQMQVRVEKDGQVGSSDEDMLTLGNVLSSKVL